MTGERGKFEAQNVIRVVREALVVSSTCYQPDGIHKAHERKV